ncbi:MAG: helix-turn-helix transcriptional regulator [Planctomycetota bacterium]|jgi:AraC-like DNA-binding protein|nr:helix-turn-helix transcriptional regulator [Planctomycetota bacterium]
MNPASIPLDSAPQILRCALGQHGRQAVEHHCLPDHWALHRYTYPCRIDAAGHALQIKPGDLTLFPPNTALRYRFPGPGCRHQFALFSLRERGTRHAVAMHHQPSATSSMILGAQFEQALQARSAARQRSAVWELLWRLVERDEAALAPEERAAARINAALGTELSVSALARELGLSADHLTRRFRARYHCTLVGYIRERRLQHAHELLTTTGMAPVQVANLCGFSDLQYFNKQIRARFAHSPRELQSR